MAGLLDDLVGMGKALIGAHQSTPQQQGAGRVVQAVTNPYSYAPNAPQQPQVAANQAAQTVQQAPPAQPLQYLLQGGVFNPGQVSLQNGGSYGNNIQPGFVPAEVANAQAQQSPSTQGPYNWNNL